MATLKRLDQFSMVSINFYTHASSQVGFGHINRCVKIARELKHRLPDLNINFECDLTGNQKQKIDAMVGATFLKNCNHEVSIFDRMDDPERPEAFNESSLNELISRSRRVVFFANGLAAPNLTSNVIIIGYKGLVKRYSADSNIFWGPEYTPVSRDIMQQQVGQNLRVDLAIALGGGTTQNLLRLFSIVLNVQNLKSSVVLLTADNQSAAEELHELAARFNVELEIVSQLDNISAFLSRANLLICSYGHLAYEALSVGKRVSLVAQKSFQFHYGRVLENLGLVDNFPQIKHICEDDLTKHIQNNLHGEWCVLSRHGVLIDNLGINRIAEIIIEATH